MNIISDFSDIARRMNRKPEFDDKGPPVPPLPGPSLPAAVPSAAAAVKTLQSLGYTYQDGAEMWKPPIGAPAGNKIPRKMTAEEHAAFRAQFLTQKAEMEQHHFDRRAAVLGEGWL